jgi:hypothetical protein
MSGSMQRLVEVELHEDEVEPLPPLVADAREAADLPKPESGVEPDRPFVRTVDAGDHHPLAGATGVAGQRSDERSTDTAHPVALSDMDRVLDGEAVSRPPVRVAEVAIGPPTDDCVVVDGDEDRMLGYLFVSKPHRALFDGVRYLGPLAGGRLDAGVRDLRDRRKIRFAGWSDEHTCKFTTAHIVRHLVFGPTALRPAAPQSGNGQVG